MKSPFPGMDPYLEPHWRDVHTRLIVYICDELQGQLTGRLRARVEERLVVEDDEDEVHAISPDARVFESARDGRPGGVLAAPRAGSNRLVIPIPDEAETERFVEVIDRGTGDRLVTVIELLSPSNKVGRAARNAYARKRAEVRAAGVNLVEIDLTRAGRRHLSVFPIPRTHRTTYQACVTRMTSPRPQFEVYAMPLRDPLPTIDVPLRAKDPDANVDLQLLLAKSYSNGAYDDIDYTRPPIPPLSPADAAWAAELLAGGTA